MDVNKGPLERANFHVNEKRLSTYIETRLSDGAKAIQFVENEEGEFVLEVQAALIAGMGGRLMVRIIEDSLDKFASMKEFILQPQSEIPKVRQFIRKMNYYIQEENMVLEDGKYYPMMKAVPIKDANRNLKKASVRMEEKARKAGIELQDLYDEYGEYLLKTGNPVLLQFLNYEKELYQDILNKLVQTKNLKSENRLKEIQEKMKYINLGLEWFEDEM